jgi:hypothetical protein
MDLKRNLAVGDCRRCPCPAQQQFNSINTSNAIKFLLFLYNFAEKNGGFDSNCCYFINANNWIFLKKGWTGWGANPGSFDFVYFPIPSLNSEPQRLPPTIEHWFSRKAYYVEKSSSIICFSYLTNWPAKKFFFEKFINVHISCMYISTCVSCEYLLASTK